MGEREKDCCFINEKDWFRYRAGAIIVEDQCVLFVGSESFDYLYTVGGGVHMGEKAEDCIKGKFWKRQEWHTK